MGRALLSGRPADATKLSFGAPQQVTEIGGRGRLGGSICVHEDASRFLVSRPLKAEEERREPIVVLNWFEELKASTRGVPMTR